MGNDFELDDELDIEMGSGQIFEKLQPSQKFKEVHDKLAQAIRELEEVCGIEVISITMSDEGPLVEAGFETEDDKDNFLAMMGAIPRN